MKTIARSVIGLMALLGAGVAGDARAQVCTNTPLPEVSAAVIPANGFALYYDDANGLALTPCLDPAAAGFCGGVAGVPVPNPAAAVAFPGNFPAEFPYFSAVATMTLPNGGKAPRSQSLKTDSTSSSAARPTEATPRTSASRASSIRWVAGSTART